MENEWNHRLRWCCACVPSMRIGLPSNKICSRPLLEYRRSQVHFLFSAASTKGNSLLASGTENTTEHTEQLQSNVVTVPGPPCDAPLLTPTVSENLGLNSIVSVFVSDFVSVAVSVSVSDSVSVCRCLCATMPAKPRQRKTVNHKHCGKIGA